MSEMQEVSLASYDIFETLDDSDLVELFLVDVIDQLNMQDGLTVAALINCLLERDADKRKHDAVAEERCRVTLERIHMVESVIEDGDLCHDSVVIAIIKRLQATRNGAGEFDESRKALRKMIDIRALAIESGYAETRFDTEVWMAIVDALHHLE